MIKDVIGRAVDQFTAGDTPEDWDIVGLNKDLMILFHKPALELTREELDTITTAEIKDRLCDAAVAIYERKEAEITPERMREIERIIMMESVDRRWMNHIDEMDQMRQGIGLRSFAQRDPLVEYKQIGYDMFQEMSDGIQQDTVRALFNVKIAEEQQLEMHQVVKMEEMSTNSGETSGAKKPSRRVEDKVGPNSPCPCGSGNKYKRCCGNK
jgi:preprotein translocase subunit SecA